MTTLHKLREAGQSPWYDNIIRELLFSGGLKKLIDSGILGLTSNPTIFQKAFSFSPLYKNQIEELIVPDTVNTMPEETMNAFIQSGKVRTAVEEKLEDAKRAIDSLENEGISVDEVCEKLQKDGVKKFIESFDALINSIAKNIL